MAIIGSGPIGLEAGLAAAERGADFRIYEAAARPGGHVRQWSHVRAFTPWNMNISERAREALAGAAPNSRRLPTGADLIERLIDPLAAKPPLSGRIELGARVVSVGREGLLKHEEISSAERASRPFRLLVRDADGAERIDRARIVIDCSGTLGTPNRLGDGGIDAPGERSFDDRIERRLPDFELEADRWAGRRVLLTGSGHSAQTAARALAGLAGSAPGTHVTWAVRRDDPDWGAIEDDPLPARAALNASAESLRRNGSPAVVVLTGTVTEALEPSGDQIGVSLRNGTSQWVEVDRVLALNGGVGDHSLYRQLQVHECYASSAPMNLSAALLAGGGGDCMAQSGHGPETLLNPEPNFFILGAKSYGRNSQFLMSIGWEQVDDVFGSLLG